MYGGLRLWDTNDPTTLVTIQQAMLDRKCLCIGAGVIPIGSSKATNTKNKLC